MLSHVLAAAPRTFLRWAHGMKHEADEVLERAMKLPADARAALAGALIESLDETIDEGAEGAWAIEIGRRLEDLRDGRVKLIPWSEARRRISGR